MRDLKTCLKMLIFNIFEILMNGRMRFRTKNMHFLTFGTSLHSFETPYFTGLGYEEDIINNIKWYFNRLITISNGITISIYKNLIFSITLITVGLSRSN